MCDIVKKRCYVINLFSLTASDEMTEGVYFIFSYLLSEGMSDLIYCFQLCTEGGDVDYMLCSLQKAYRDRSARDGLTKTRVLSVTPCCKKLQDLDFFKF